MSLPASVIIPSYNRLPMLQEAIASVFAQKQTPFELIVIDDGSTDGTGGTLASVAPPAGSTCVAFSVLRTESRTGAAAARNRGAAAAQGEYLSFLDSDDLWHRDKLRLQLAFMREHPILALSQTQEIWLREGRVINPARRHLKRAGDIFIPSLRLCLISCSAVMIRREVFMASGGFDERMFGCEDYDLWLRLTLSNEVGLLDLPLVTRRAGYPGQSQLSATIPALDRFRVRALMKLLAWPASLSEQREWEVVKVLIEKCGIIARGLERRGLRAEAEFYLRVAGAARRRLEHDSEPLGDKFTWQRMLAEQPLEVAA